MICYIVGALPCKPQFSPKTDDLVIAADKGIEYLIDCGIRIDVALGDFDSVGVELPNVKTVKYPVIKDNTDTDLAIEYGKALGYKTFVIYGCIGGRFDHTFANIGLLNKFTTQGLKLFFVDGENVIFAITKGKVSFSENCSGIVSIFSLCEKSFGVTETGLLYELNNYELVFGTSLGVSNEFVGKPSEISVDNGCIMVYTKWQNLLDSSFSL